MATTLGLLVLSVASQSAAVIPSAEPGPARSIQGVAHRVSHPGSAGTVMLDWGDVGATPRAWKGNYVVLQPWEFAQIPRLKSKNPNIQVFMYKDVSATVKAACPDDACTRDNKVLPSGVGYHWALRHHPGWFLRDARGRQVEWSDWPGLFAMNVANRGYQERWASSVESELRAHDWDGVMMDDVLTTLSHTAFAGRVSTRIPDDASMYAATERFLSAVGPSIKDGGFVTLANVSFQYDDWRTVLEDWSPYVTGWENEYFVKWGLDDGSGRFVGDDWRWKMRLAAWCARREVPLLAVSYSTTNDAATQTYHRATWLLTWNGRTGSSAFVPDQDFTDHWLPRPTVELGQPVARRYRVDREVYRRDYTGGTVLVNPSDRVHRIRLDRPYRGLNGRVVETVRLQPASAVILRAER